MMEANISLLCLFFKIKHLLIYNKTLAVGTVSIFKWLNLFNSMWNNDKDYCNPDVIRRISWLLFDCTKRVLDKRGKVLLSRTEYFTCLEAKNRWNKVKVGKCVTRHAASHLKPGSWYCCSHHCLACFILGFVCLLRDQANHRRPPAAPHLQAAAPPT